MSVLFDKFGKLLQAVRIFAIGGSVLFGGSGFAASGTLVASPEVVIIAAGQTNGESLLSWTSEQTEIVYLTVSCDGAGESVVGYSLPSGSINIPWISAGRTCDFRLRAESAEGDILDDVAVEGVLESPSGVISANPMTVFIPSGISNGATEIAWSAVNSSMAFLMVDCGSGIESEVGQVHPTGTLLVDWITPSSECSFRLRSASGSLLDEVTVTGSISNTPSGSIAASPNPVPVPTNRLHGTTHISWNAEDTEYVYLTVSCGGAAESEVGFAYPNGNIDVDWISVGISCMFRLRAETLDGTILDAVDVVGVASELQAAVISATPEIVYLPSTQPFGSTELRWDLGASTSGILTRTCGGLNETVMRSVHGSGSLIYDQVEVYRGCVFRLRDDAGGVLSSVSVYGANVNEAGDFASLLFGPSPQPGQFSVGRTEDICFDGHRTGQIRQITRFESGLITLDNVTGSLRFSSIFDVDDGFVRNRVDAILSSSEPGFAEGATYTLIPPLPYARLDLVNGANAFENWAFEYCAPSNEGKDEAGVQLQCSLGSIDEYEISHGIVDTPNYRLLMHTEYYKDNKGELRTVSEFDLNQGRLLGFWRSAKAPDPQALWSDEIWYHVCPEEAACGCYNAHPPGG